MKALQQAILKQINKRKPVDSPAFVVGPNGDLVRNVVEAKGRSDRRPRPHGIIRLADFWPIQS